MIDELVELVEGGHADRRRDGGRRARRARQAEDVREVFEDVVWRHRGKKIAPKTVNQKRYVDAIRARTVTFGIGPAGTGKTYLAMALAVAALQERQVARIILTRPAVEAGERLGFLPGDMLAKVDPYLRPLFDALYDMLDAERAERLHGDAARSRWRRSRSCAGAPSTTSFIILDEAQNTTPGADADVPDPARLRLEGRRHRRRHPGRPARATRRPGLIQVQRDPRRRSRASRSSSSATRTSCATSSCSGSSRPTAARGGDRHRARR